MTTVTERSAGAGYNGTGSGTGQQARVLLNSPQMAEFVSRGFLRFEGVVPAEVNERAIEEMRSRGDALGRRYEPGVPLRECFGEFPGVREAFGVPVVAGAIESLVGPDPVYDHHAIHRRIPGERGQHLHADAIIDLRAAFDIQLMYYPEAVSREAGGTLLVPGSHFRRIREVSRYQNHRGQVRVVCPAGTVVVVHHGIWHCGRANRTSGVRYMFKLRLEPSVDQVRRWDVSDLASPEVRREVVEVLEARQPWYESQLDRLEVIQRAALWRRLTGDRGFQLEYWLGRLENQAGPQLVDLLPSAAGR
jgi:hypothetical protein